MVKSSFSGKEIPPGTGIMYVKKDGRILHFLNRKEEKNMIHLGRKPRTTTWTEEYRKEKVQRAAAAEHKAQAKKKTTAKKSASKKK